MKTLYFISIIAASAAIAMFIGVGVLMLTGSMSAFASVSIFGALFIALILGAFDVKDKKNNSHYESIRHRRGQAAVFIGTACVFLGTQQQCEDITDDLWHWGQQARVEQLSDGQDFDVL